MTGSEQIVGRRLKIGICGTFDVENFGDLLFPLVAEAELSRRLGPIELHRFSYFSKGPPDWPYAVSSISDLPATIGALDGMMIGGGDLIRFDKGIAPGYAPPTSDIHHPTGYWLTPALLALQHDCPVAWNAPGVFGEIAAWAQPLLQLAIKGSGYVAVRDEPSRQALAPFAVESEIALVPDTCFGVAGLLDPARASAAFDRLRETLGLKRPYIVVQATPPARDFCRLLRKHPGHFRDYQILALEIGPVLGDNGATLVEDLPDIIQLPSWPHPLLLAELIKEAEGVVGVSLHLAITALAFGVPVFRPSPSFGGKYAVLRDFGRVHPFDLEQEPKAPSWVTEKLGRVEAPPGLREIPARLDAHWDKVAATFTAGRTSAASREIGNFWQSLPGLLETEATRHEHTIDALRTDLAAKRQRIDEQSSAIADLYQHVSTLDSAILELNQRVATLDAAISQRDKQIELRDILIVERDAQIENRDILMAERDKQIQIRDTSIAERDHQIAALDGALAHSRRETTARNEQIIGLQNSTSWKLTAPVRWLGAKLRSNKNGRT